MTSPDSIPPTDLADWLKNAKRNAKDFPTEITVRELIAKWGAKTRGQRVIHQVRSALRSQGLTTAPDFAGGQIVPAPKGAAADDIGSETTNGFLKVDSLRSARRQVKTIAPDAVIGAATTMMSMFDFSQLAVVVGQRSIKGAVSWESIGRATQFRDVITVGDALTEATTVSGRDELLPHLKSVAEKGFVFVTGQDHRLAGIVTASDITDEFGELAEPFFLLGAIERRLRTCVRRGRFTAQEIQERLKEPSKPIEQVDDLTFGEIILIMQPEENWKRIGASLDRKVFLDQLERVREIRNSLMHFSPDPPSPEDITMLRNTAQVLRAWVGD
jgi:restriction system protein